MRGDIWHDLVFMVSGQRNFGPNPVSSVTTTFDINTFESNTVDADRDNIDALGVAQCVYNDDTLITWGGWDYDSIYFNQFYILGGILFC